jgi:hypothetical protein
MQPLVLVLLRLVLGAVMIGHGWLKVNGHLHEFADHAASLGMPAWLGYVSAFTEFGGGILLILGPADRMCRLCHLDRPERGHRQGALETRIHGPGRLRISAPCLGRSRSP